jgi:hypothetical protein
MVGEGRIAVGTPIAGRPPHRSVRAAFPHTAPTSGDDGHAGRARFSICDTPSRFCARRVLCRSAFPSAPALRSTRSAPGRPVLFAGFTATTAGSDFSCPCIAGYGSSPSRRGPHDRAIVRSGTRSPRFRRVPFVRDGDFDHDRASAPRIAVPHMLPSTGWKVSASVILTVSRLNSPPHTIAVYASWPPSPAELMQHSLPGGRCPLPGPDFHRLEPASFLAHPSTSLLPAQRENVDADLRRHDDVAATMAPRGALISQRMLILLRHSFCTTAF